MTDKTSTPVLVRLSPQQVEAVDQWRREENDLPSRPEAIRRMIQAALREKGYLPTEEK